MALGTQSPPQPGSWSHSASLPSSSSRKPSLGSVEPVCVSSIVIGLSPDTGFSISTNSRMPSRGHRARLSSLNQQGRLTPADISAQAQRRASLSWEWARIPPGHT